MSGMDASPWSSATRQAIGRALLAAGRSGLTVAELALATSRDASNTRRTADAMVRDGLLVSCAARRVDGALGRPANLAYTLAQGQLEALEQAATREIGQLAAGQQLVFAEASDEQLEDLFHVLAAGSPAARATWCALADGDRQEYLVAFEGDDAASAAVDLMTSLAAAEVRCRRLAVSELMPAVSLLRRAQAATRAAQQVRMRRATRRGEAAAGDSARTSSAVGDPGLEPGTSSLSEKRSNRLS